jgi:hypothetical protein
LPDKTAADGGFTVEVTDPEGTPIAPSVRTPVTLFAVLPGVGLAASAQVTDAAAPVTLRLAPGAYGTVHVTDPQGRPLAKAAFRSCWCRPGLANFDGEGYGEFELPETASDDQGIVRFGPMPTGTLLAWLFSSDGCYVTSEAWAKEDLPHGVHGPFPVKSGETVVLPDMVIDRTGRSASGWVADVDGKPVADALVIGEEGSNPTCRTDPRGFFTLTGLALQGPLWLVVAHPTRSLFAGQQLKMEPGAQAHFVLHPLGALIGQIMNDQHQPVAGAQVWVHAGDNWDTDSTELVHRLQFLLGRPGAKKEEGTPGVLCDKQGRFRFDDLLAPVNSYRLTVSWLGFSGAPPAEINHCYAVKPGETTDTGPLVVKPQPPLGDNGPAANLPPPPATPGAGGPTPAG